MSIKSTIQEAFGLNESEWKVAKWFTIASIVSAATFGGAVGLLVYEAAQVIPQHVTIYTGK